MTKLKILDLGCNQCEWSEEQGYTKENYVGLDTDITALKKARQNGHQVLLVNLEDKKLPFKDETFDLVIAKDILEHINSYIDITRQAHCVLKRGGRLFIQVPSEWSHNIHTDYTHTGKAWTVDSIHKMLSDCGFYIYDFKKAELSLKLLTINPKVLLKYLTHYVLKNAGLNFSTQGYIIWCKKTEKRLKP